MKLTFSSFIFLILFSLLLNFNILIVSEEQNINKIDVSSMWKQVMSDLPADEFYDDIYIDSLTTQELVDWAKEIAQACLQGNASSVYNVELSPPESAQSFAKQMRYKNVEEQQFYTTADKQIEIER